jgi:hypothetical protein
VPLSKSRLKTRRIGGSASAAVAGVSRYKGMEETRREYVYRMHGAEGVKKYLSIPVEAVNPEDYLTVHRAPGDVIRVRRYYPDGTPNEEFVREECARLEQNIDNIHTRVGSFLEGFILNRVSADIIHGSVGLPGGDESGLLLPLNEAGDDDPRAEVATAEIDGYRETTIHECKAILVNRKPEFRGTLPPDYLFQCNHYLLWPYFQAIELHALFLTMQEKELIDAMVRGWLLDVVPDDGEEHIVTGFGACTIKQDYRMKALPMRREVIERIVELAPMETIRIEKSDTFQQIREYHLSAYNDFWHRVTCNIPCVARDWRECQTIYAGRNSRKTKIADDKEKRLYLEVCEIKETEKKNKLRLEGIKAELQTSAMDAERIVTIDGDALYSIEERYTKEKDENLAVFLLKDAGHAPEDFLRSPGLNWDLIKEAEPEVYAACRKKGERNVYFKGERE